MFFVPGVLNIFCDASIVPKPDRTYYGCPGAIALHTTDARQIVKIDEIHKLFSNSTNNHSEISAILLACYLANKHQYNYQRINIFSDSKISVMGLRSWMYNWLQNKDKATGVMYNSSGEEVANQEIFLQIVRFILDTKVEPCIYHVKGHVNVGRESDMAKAMSTFKTSNGFDIDRRTATHLAMYNEMVDHYTRNTLKTNLESATYITKNPILYHITRKDLWNFNQVAKPRGM